ncbi:MAG: ATP-binding protein [Methanosphaera stadtmanae]|jgi:hypothetical protein|nr:ATP-binding protein [Methanosphaera stadtmanae]
MMEIGRCIGETTPYKVEFISKTTPAVGEYVYLEYGGKTILGMIDTLFRGSTTLGEDLLNPETIAKILELEGDMDHYIRGTITILGDKDKLIIPRTPAPPGTQVMKADSHLLKSIFEKDNQGIKIGTLLNQEDVAVKLDVNKMVSRHLAILAMTGAGKSNTTSVIIDELLRIGGTIVVYDMHSEYSKTEFKNGQTHIIPSKINPRDLSEYEYRKLGKFSESATNQLPHLRKAYEYARDLDEKGTEYQFIDNMIFYIQSQIQKYEAEEDSTMKKHIEACQQVLFKLEDMTKKYHKIFQTDTTDMVDNIIPGKVNIISLGSLNETATDILVNHMLRNILQRRKNVVEGSNNNAKTLDFPVFCVVEEAHMLASHSINTKSKGTIGQIAREGRKFGVGLCLVSQSPKSLDSGALSQVNNLIILRLVEPGDQKHVQNSSESLSNDLLQQLPSLNIGEAIVLGQMVKIPTMVKIDEFKGKSVGSDLDIVGIWSSLKEEKEQQDEEDFDDIMRLA